MSAYEISPGYLQWPGFMARLQRQRHRQGHKGHPMTTSLRHRLEADWYDDAPYDSRIRGGRVLVTRNPVGTRREMAWRAVTRRWRSNRVPQLCARSGIARVSLAYDDMAPRFDGLGEQAARTARTIDDTLLERVSRVELYEALADVYDELHLAGLLAFAIVCACIVLLISVMVSR